jgi:hypothetical protein
MKLFSLLAAAVLAAATALAEDPATFEVGGFTFKRPADWGWVQVNSPMRKAQLKVPGGEQPGDVVFFHFGPGGGDAKANVDRWFKQFSGAPAGAEKTEEQTYGKTKVTYAETEGTFASGMPGGPSSALQNYALVGAILDGPEGAVFVKLTGPKALVKASHEKFVDFVKDAAQSRK